MTNEQPQPTADSIDTDAIPAALRNKKQWICWEYEDRDGKSGKVPVQPSGQKASISDPDTWCSFDVAVCSHYSEMIDSQGIGFVFTELDPFAGVDLDDCVNEQGDLTERTSEIVSRLDSYTEYSPSGTGVHVLVEGELPQGSNRSDGIELYDSSRYFTVTGNHIDNTPVTVERREVEIEEIHEDYLGTEATSDDATAPPVNTGGGEDSADTNSLTDEEVLEKAKNCKNKNKFDALWSGDTSGYRSHSEADSALCCLLSFWAQGDPDQIDRLFRQSNLMRSKWDENHGDQTYGDMTIANSMADNYYSGTTNDESMDNKQNTDTTIADVEQVVRENFDPDTWNVTEAMLSAHATLLLKNADGGTGLVITGPSGSGKSTILKFLDGLDEMVYRSDDVTPASFVSHDSSKSEEQLQEIDLLPRVAKKTLLVKDMASWFSGDQEVVRSRMSIMTDLMDGDGYTRDSGSHGQRGYEGKEYLFNFIGATTPLSASAWDAMGTVGNRLVFHEKNGDVDTATIIGDLNGGSEYIPQVNRCRNIVHQFIEQLWSDQGGVGSIEFEGGFSDEVANVLELFTELVQYARSPIVDDSPEREVARRIARQLFDIARGRAILNGRTQVTMSDMQLTARVALSTMPSKRRSLIQALVDPAGDNQLSAGQVESIANVSRPTALTRMKVIETLGIGTITESDGKGSTTLVLNDRFSWPDSLDFPDF